MEQEFIGIKPACEAQDAHQASDSYEDERDHPQNGQN